MAVGTLGTNANTSLASLTFGGALAPADIAQIQLHILNDLINGNPIFPGAFQQSGLLYVPNRGVLQLRPGDVVAYDSTGWPVLVSGNAIANGPWHQV